MKNIIRIKELKIKNIKNVGNGNLKADTNFEKINEGNIIGLYGQNGSGKTALVEAFSLLKNLIATTTLPKNEDHLISEKSKTLELSFDFLVLNKFGKFTVKYQCTILNGDNENLTVNYEKISYKENLPKKKFKDLVKKDSNDLNIRNKNIDLLTESLRVDTKLANKLASSNNTSFIFRNELKDILKSELTEIEFEIIKNLKVNFIKDLFIIKGLENGLIMANILLPINVYLETTNNHVRGNISYDLKSPMVLPKQLYNIYTRIIPQINLVLGKIIPNLQIEIKKLNEETLNNGEIGIRCELLSLKNGLSLPLRCESDGILKIITILSALIAVYNNPNACVVIDELDSGVFEYLLGEILDIIDERCKGQLFFTSHNLRPLEVLNSKNLWFTTNNKENRYIQLKGIKKNSNARDVYLRAVQLGGQQEEVYQETDSYDIKKAFKKAGDLDV